jgi:hypothetical protein
MLLLPILGKGAVLGHNIHTEFYENQSTGSNLQAIQYFLLAFALLQFMKTS